MLTKPCPDCNGLAELTTADGEPVWTCPDCGFAEDAEDDE